MRIRAEDIAALTPDQRALLLRRLDRKGGGAPEAPAAPPIPRRAPGERCPASLDQERLWFLHLLDPQSAAYNVDIPMRIRGSIDIPVLQRVMNEIVRRHEAWRTTFAMVDGEPVQIVAPALALQIPVIDLRGLDGVRREDLLMELALAEIRRPFDLEKGPLVRFSVHLLGPEDLLVVLVVHHIVTDWITMKQYWTELVTLYEAFAAGRPSPLPDPPLHFADFAVWQRRWLAEGGIEKHLQYWRDHLAGMPLVLELPTDRPRQPVRTGRGRSVGISLGPAVSEAVRRISRRESASPFMTLMALYKALLWRFTGQDKIILGSPSANRNRPELETVMGFFLTQLVFATDLSGDPPAVELVRRERQVALGAFAHQEVPFSLLLKELQPERDLSRPPVVQATFFTLEQGDRHLPAHQVDVWFLEDGAARWELVFFLWDHAEKGFYGWFEYDVDLFDRATVARLGESFQTLLAAALACEGTRLSDLPYLGEAQRHQLLHEWRPGPAGGAGRPLPELFREQARRTPDAEALVAGGLRLTYGELDRRASRLARHLRSLGVGPEDRVGVLAGRSADLVVALLAVLAAGGAYVPLDPAYPAERLRLLLEDADAGVVIADDRLLDRLPADRGGRSLVRLEADREAIARAGEGAPASGVLPGNLAYLIYTSGSTGRPKAVAVTHGSAGALVDWALAVYSREQLSAVLAATSIAFDLSVFELFAPLACGGKVVLAENALELPGLAAAGEVTLINTVPSAIAGLLRLEAVPAAARTVNLAGEPLPRALADRLYALGTVERVFNLYGPSEDTTYSTGGLAERGDARAPSIGRPLPGRLACLLDGRFQPVLPGAPGELHLGGEGLARGYFGRPELTAERFVPDPFAATPGARLYRTGDLARHRADGALEFLGRLDHQVKVRGFRIELGEVEAALRSLPGVREAVAAVQSIAGGRLIAYLVAENGLEPAAGELRNALQERVPEPMIPSVFVWLEDLPRTPTGKVDRRALPDPGPERPAPAGSYVAPRDETEERLAALWADVLGVAQVGLHDNFFELGGDSILSVQVVSRARQSGLVLTPRLIFQHPTVAELAAFAGAVPARAAGVDPVAGPVTGPVPLTPIQRFFFGLDLGARHHFNQSALFETERTLAPPLLERVIGAVVHHHDALRHRFLPSDQGWRQVADAPGGPVPCGFVDLTALPPGRHREQIEAVAARLQGSLDLERGPVFRAVSFGLAADGPGRLLLVAHHLIVDFFSWRPLLQDLHAAWDQAEGGAAIALPPRTSSFRSWAEGLAALAGTPALRAELPYWLDERRRHGGRLAADFPSGRAAGAPVGRVSAVLDEETTRALLAEIPACHLEVQEVLLTALVRALAPRTGGRVLAVDCEGYGRDMLPGLDFERTVGWFAWMVPVLLDLRGVEEPGAELKAVKERLRSLPNRGLGYGLLRYCAAAADPEIEARFRELPEAEVSFNYLGQIDRLGPQAAGFRAAPESVGPAVAAGGARPHRLEITVAVGERLRAALSFSEGLFRRATIESLAEAFLAEVRTLVAHCLATRLLAFTPADFPLAGIDQEALDALAGREVEDLYPLTPLQQGMLFHCLYAPGEGLYVNQMIWELDGDLDLAAFVEAWQAVADRHPALRTGFVWESADRPLQRVHRQVEVPHAEHDWRGLSRAETEARLARFLAEDRRRGFDLTRPPLMRLASMRTGAGEWIFVWTSHHLPYDGWCVPLIFREVQDCYHARRAGRAWRAPRPRPYREYIAWLAGQDPARAEAWWRERLAGFTEPTPVGSLRPAAAGGAGTRGEVQAALEPAATAALVAAARASRLTLSTLLQAAWALWLARSGGEDDVVFGITVSGRPAELPGVESMVGLFLNTLPVRVRVAPESRLLSWLGEIQEQLAEIRQREATPLADVHRVSEVPADLPLFETLSVFENHPVDPAVREPRAGLGVRSMRVVEKSSYPIVLTVVPGERLALTLIYDEARWETAAALRTLEQLQTVLAALAERSAERIADLPFLGAAARHQMMVEWNDSGPADSGRLAHERFAAQAARDPRAVAVVRGAARLTYGELDLRADRLARRLRNLGVGPEARVALHLDRSIELAVAILGVWKAGGAYVPLDPDYPAQRLALLLRDSRPALVLTRPGLTGALPPHDLPTLWLDAADGEEGRAEEPGGAVEHGADGGTAAYVIYTSGSTGEPKGVVVEHRGLANLVAAQIAGFALRPGSRVLQFASPSFDASVSEIATALCSGATLCFVEKDELLPGPPLARLLRELAITHVTLSPVAVASLPATDLPALETLIVAGEAFPPDVAARWRAGRRLINAYGPTESSVCATLTVLGEDRRVPIGRPLAGFAVHVLDRGQEPAPLGTAGELCIGGVGLTRGYVGRPGQTAEKLVPDPFSGQPGARLYRTGDLARWAADGQLDFLGRIDHQVKVRGFRIETGEVEAALRQAPGVREAVVAVHDDGTGKRLLGYVVPQDGGSPAAGELRAFLRERLPDFMVPSLFVTLAGLPLSPAGKVDRRALPGPAGAEPGRPYTAPRDPVEEQLAAIWSQVLRVPRVGVHDNFFELGGDSILSLQIVSRAHRAGLGLSPRQIFQHQTIEELAAAAGLQPAAAGEQGLVTGPVPLTPIQRWMFEQGFPEPHRFAQAVRLAVPDELDLRLLPRAIERLVAHHDALRLRFSRAGSGWSQRNAGLPDPAGCVWIDLAALPEGRRGEALERAAVAVESALDFERGPLLRGACCAPAPGGGRRLLLAVHHLAVDAVSWSILLDDLDTACRQLAAGAPVELPAKTTSYRRWAERLEEHVRSGALDAEAELWAGMGAEVLPPLPVDLPGGTNDLGSQRTVTALLDEETTRALLTDVPPVYRTEINDVLLTALAQGFARWTGDRRLRVDLEGHGREELFADVDLSRTVGWFTTIYPVMLDLGEEGGDAGEEILQVKEALRAVPRRGIGYGLLRHLGGGAVAARLRALPRAEVGFNYLGQLGQAAPETGGGPAMSPRTPRIHLIDVEGRIVAGRLRIDLSYSAGFHLRSTIERLAENYLAALRGLVAHCQSPEAGGSSLSDFPLARLGEGDLERLLREIEL